MTTTSSLRKKALSGPKYVLELNGFFVSDKQELSGINLTERIEEARTYSVEFDSLHKTSIWNAYLSDGQKFTPKYL